MIHHASNRSCLEGITVSIPWHPDKITNLIQVGDWISMPNPNPHTPPDWVYYVLELSRDIARAIEFKKIMPNGRIQATTHQALTLSTKGYHPIRILSKEKSEATLKVARDTPIPDKNPLTYWIFETGFIQELP
jgi:hypothetical protein